MKLRPRNRDDNNNNNRVELDRSKIDAYHPPKVGAKIFESSFFDAILESSSCDVGVSQHVAPTNIQYEDIRKSLELRYGVEITSDAVQAACEILTFIYVHNEEPYLPKVGVAQLLEAAASKLRDDFDHDSGEKDFDRYMFLFDRAFVESREIEKEKNLQSCGFPYVKEELEELKCVLEAFTKRWAAPSSPYEDHMSSPRSEYFRCLRDGLGAILRDTESHSDVDLVAKAIQTLRDPVFALLRTVDVSLKRLLTVNSRTVVEVASSITGVPRSFFPPPFQLPLELLVRKLSGRLVGLDSQIRTILYAMSNQKPRSSHLYSFLLLGPPSSGKTALAHALAREMFDDRIVEYDVADFVEKDFFEQVCSPYSVIKETDWTSDSSIQFISGCVVVFGNVDKANTTVLDSILQILEGGSYVDAVGRRIVFSNVLIVFTLNMRLPLCDCASIMSESSFKPPFKDLLNSEKERKVPNCRCNFHEQLTEAVDRFKPRFFDSLDDVIVLPWVSMSEYMSIFRIQVRNIAPLCKKKVVVYASAAVFCRAFWKKFCLVEERGRAVECFVEDLVNELCDVEGDTVVYIDQLLGSNELSFRFQKISDMAVVRDFRTFKESLRSSMVSYQFEKEQAKLIYTLSTTYFGLVELLDSKDEASLSCVLSSVAGLLNMVAYQLERSLVNYWMAQVLRPQPFNHDADNVHDRVKRARYMSEFEFSKMRNKLCEQIPPVQVVAKALFKSIDAHHGHSVDEPCQQASSFLVLGLRSMDRCLVDSLSKYFVADDGTRMLVEVDLSACTNPNSFCCCTCRNEPSLLLKTAILMRPYSVIVFYNLELAHLSAFANIISILDDGLLNDDGVVLDFRKSVIIFVSNLGNKHIIASLVGGPDGSDSRDGSITKGSIGFRFEILNRVHEILLFNPFASDQILHSARLPMKVGQHLLVTSPGITDVLVHLFNEESDGRDKLEVDGKMTKAGNCRSRLTRRDAILCLFPLRKGLVKI